MHYITGGNNLEIKIDCVVCVCTSSVRCMNIYAQCLPALIILNEQGESLSVLYEDVGNDEDAVWQPVLWKQCCISRHTKLP